MRTTYECRSITLTLYNKRQCECYYCNNLTWTKIGILNSLTSLVCLCVRLFYTNSNVFMYAIEIFVLEIWILENYLVFKPYFFLDSDTINIILSMMKDESNTNTACHIWANKWTMGKNNIPYLICMKHNSMEANYACYWIFDWFVVATC